MRIYCVSAGAASKDICRSWRSGIPKHLALRLLPRCPCPHPQRSPVTEAQDREVVLRNAPSVVNSQSLRLLQQSMRQRSEPAYISQDVTERVLPAAKSSFYRVGICAEFIYWDSPSSSFMQDVEIAHPKKNKMGGGNNRVKTLVA